MGHMTLATPPFQFKGSCSDYRCIPWEHVCQIWSLLLSVPLTRPVSMSLFVHRFAVLLVPVFLIKCVKFRGASQHQQV